MNGIFNIDKKAGVSSAFVVNRIKYRLKQKCGHMGTLDPLASGVLPIAVGKSTRLFDYLLDKKKVYRAKFTFGETTDTLDGEGAVTDRCDYIPTEKEIKKAIKEMTGKIMQMPPKYSAKKVGGKRGYDLARSGIDFELKPKEVEIYDIIFIEQTGEKSYLFDIICGGGTYIRSVCRDLAEKTNSLAFMSNLVRTASGNLTIENSIALDEFLELTDSEIENMLIVPDALLDFPVLKVENAVAKNLLNGIKTATEIGSGLYRLYDSSFIGIAESDGKYLKIKTLIR